MILIILSPVGERKTLRVYLVFSILKIYKLVETSAFQFQILKCLQGGELN